ncbi:hypothetical protein PPYR_13806 [Photinus pyralis]|uniref:Glycosyltransferase family 92 protein n=1 Tax=Photinus pyralis TaxID=7054 RepID=A0A5N4AA29_PHOPY|nr:uncharacterized protein LOC116178690 [Photinus pyralis]KAB0794186.1 hypothetical protein PPYR_13806 [Photinus pyralis]
MQPRLHYVTLVILLSVFLTFYVSFLLTLPVSPIPATPKTNLKEIIGYSLLKKIEIESERASCAELIRPKKVRFQRSEMWTLVPGTNLHVFNVYYDDRLKPYRYLRLIGMMKGTTNQTLYCQTEMKDKIYHITRAIIHEIWLKEWNEGDEQTFNPVLISCSLPTGYIPQTLSINSDQCTLSSQTFNIIVPRVQETKDNYTTTVCVKSLNFVEDISVRLMQWIEMNRLLGADRFHFFVGKIHKNVHELLRFYSRKLKDRFVVRRYRNVESVHGNEDDLAEQKRRSRHLGTLNNKNVSRMSSSVNNKRPLRDNDTFETVNYTEVFYREVWQKRRNEVITYNDCMYRNLRSSHFVIPLDIDEVIIPRVFYTWRTALRHIFEDHPTLHERYASFSVRNAYFLEEYARSASTNVFFFDYIKRSQFSDEGESGKSFVYVKNTLSVFNHYSLEALKPGIRRTFFLPEDLLQKNHYKPTCLVALLPQCTKYTSSQIRIEDALINKYRTDFFKNYRDVYRMFTNKSDI